jgi:hypothetical protein
VKPVEEILTDKKCSDDSFVETAPEEILLKRI